MKEAILMHASNPIYKMEPTWPSINPFISHEDSPSFSSTSSSLCHDDIDMKEDHDAMEWFSYEFPILSSHDNIEMNPRTTLSFLDDHIPIMMSSLEKKECAAARRQIVMKRRATIRALQKSTWKKKTNIENENKAAIRKAKNRHAATISRQKQQEKIQSLENQVCFLTKRNEALEIRMLEMEMEKNKM